MYLSTFTEEELIDTPNLVVKSLYILAFITPREDTNIRIRYHSDKVILEKIRYNPIFSKYTFLSMVNPTGYNLVAKQLPKPQHRNSIEEDFLFVESESLHEYLQMVDVLSATIALN